LGEGALRVGGSNGKMGSLKTGSLKISFDVVR